MAKKFPKITTSIVANSVVKGSGVLPAAKKSGMKWIKK